MHLIYARFYPAREYIDTIIYDREIYDRITDDHCPPADAFKMQYQGMRFIGGYVNDEIASLFAVHGDKMHFMVLKAYRKHARELLNASFDLWPHRVWVEIPSLYKSVINFAKNYGFREIKVEKAGHLKNGLLYDKHLLEYDHGNG